MNDSSFNLSSVLTFYYLKLPREVTITVGKCLLESNDAEEMSEKWFKLNEKAVKRQKKKKKEDAEVLTAQGKVSEEH